MSSVFFVLAGLGFFFLVIVQLIRMNILILKLNKDISICQKDKNEKQQWEFIKGLY